MTGLLDDDGLLDLRPRARRTDPGAVLAEEKGRREGLPERNRDLEAWQASRSEEAPDPTAMTAPDGLCPLCRERPGRHACNRCGAVTCSADHWIMFGLCRNCATEERVRRWHDERRPEDDDWLGG